MIKRLILLITISLFATSYAIADEVISTMDDAGLATLNEELRQSSSGLRNTKSLVTTLQADVDALEAEFDAFQGVPQGAIIMWSGTIATIPTGWELSDGSCSITCPDLRDRFIVGATSDSGGFAMTNVTGSLTQSGNGQIPEHSHTYNAPSNLVNKSNSAEDSAAVTTVSSTNTGTYGSGTKNVAVYYALAFIIKT